MKKRRFLALAAAFAMLTSVFTPVYANEVDLDVTSIFEDDTNEYEEYIDENDTNEDDIVKAMPADSNDDDEPVTLGYSVQLDEEEIEEDDVEKEAADWYYVNQSNKTLTISGQLPDTIYYSTPIPVNIATVIIEPNTKAGKSLRGLFANLRFLTSIEGLSTNLDTSETTDMSSMFSGCESLMTVDLSNINTSNVTNMSYMFKNCYSLSSLELSNFNTCKVTSMESMFTGCRNLTSLDLSCFDTQYVNNINNIFYGCTFLSHIDISNFNMTNVISKENVFLNCTSLETISLPNGFNISSDMCLLNRTNLYNGWAKSGEKAIVSGDQKYAAFSTNAAGEYIYTKWFSLSEDKDVLYISGQIPESANNILQKNINITDITKIIIEPNTKAYTSLDYTFNGFKNLVTIEGLSNIDTQNVTSMVCMFQGCISLISIDLSGWNTSKLTDMLFMFDNCSSLQTINLSGLDTTHVTNMEAMFSRCSSLESLDLSTLDTSSVTNMGAMFSKCSSLRIINLSGWDVSNVKKTYLMFEGCEALTSLNLSGWNKVYPEDIQYMFRGCSSLSYLDLSSFDLSNISNTKNMDNVFSKCTSISSLLLPAGFTITSNMYLRNIDIPKIGWTLTGKNDVLSGGGSYAAFTTEVAGEYVLRGEWYDWDKTTGTLILNGQLPNTSSYHSIAEYAAIDGRSVNKVIFAENAKAGKSLSYAFYYFINLKEIEGFSNLDMINTTDISGIFNKCYSLSNLDLSGLDTSSIINMSSMFQECSSLKNIDLSIIDTSNVTNMGAMFCNCTSLKYINLTGLDTSNVKKVGLLFSGCKSLVLIDLKLIDFSNVTDIRSMFYGCELLTHLDLTNINIDNLEYMDNIFYGCSSLKSINFPAGFKVKADMYLPNGDTGWCKTGSIECISGIGDFAIFTADTAGEYVRIPHDHSYSTPEYTWANDYSTCTAECVCTRCNEKVIEEGIVSDNVILPASCTKKGKTSYTSVFTNELFTTQEKIVENIDIIPHSYSKPEWIWSNDNSIAKAVFTCKSCENNTTISAKITETITMQPTEEQEGKKTVTATVTFNGKTYSDKKEVIMPVVEITYPKNIKVEPGNGKMNVTWTPVKGASYYEIYYSSANLSCRIRREADKNGAYINGLENGTYDVFVVAVTTYQTDHGTGMSAGASDVVTVDLKPYYVPCKTQAVESGAINITWDKFVGASRYRVVCIDKNNNVRDTKTTSNLSFKWTGLKNGETYGFYVQPYVNGVYPTFTRTDANDKKYIQWTCPVNSPMITKLSLGNQKVWLYYESVPRATKYYIYYKQKGDTKDTLAGTTTATKFLVTKLKNNVSTEFYVKALVDGKLTPLKRPATRTTRAGMKPTITVTSGQAALKWSKYTDCKASATKYKVIFVDANYKQIDTRETANLAFTWKDKRLVKGNKYGFYVVPYVNGEYIPFGLSHAEDKANVVMFTAK